MFVQAGISAGQKHGYCQNGHIMKTGSDLMQGEIYHNFNGSITA